ncbi:kinesin-like polypeptide [Trifolium pratense]|uniref:Kinesin-like polypeptide n=1 Tax=Trifolium pratense TaxID=57577 RepID=A0A2K3LVE4_TRIPR|nr:kinesin-like polypeptide [Trifolium pratense]
MEIWCDKATYLRETNCEEKLSEAFMKSLWTMSPVDGDGYMSDGGHDRNEEGSYPSLHSLVHQYLYDEKLAR